MNILNSRYGLCKSIGALATAALLSCSTVAFSQMAGQAGGGSQTGASAPQGAAQQNQQNQQAMSGISQQGSSDMADKVFLKKAMQGSMAEIQLGQLALTKSSNDQVKQFAQKMIDDHGKLNDQAKPVAMQNNVPVPAGPSKKDKAVMAKLQTMSGAAFDKAYIQDMVKDHQADDKDFKTEAMSGQNSSIKDLASQGEPIIASHLQMVQQISKSMGGM